MYSIQLEGDVRKLLRQLNRIEGVDTRRLNTILAEGSRSSTLDRFKQQRGPDGKRWKPSIRAQQTGGVTLTKSADLKNSIKDQAEASGFAVGTNKVYASTHQLGEKGRRITIKAKTSKGLVFKIGDTWIRKKQVDVNVKIPERPFLGLDDDDLAEIKATVEDFVWRE